MATEADQQNPAGPAEDASRRRARRENWPARAPDRLFSPLTQRILAVNVLALGLLVAGLLFLGQYKQNLIRAELEGLKVQAEMLASAVGETAVIIGPPEGQRLRIRQARVLLRRLVEPMQSRARLFNLDGALIGDTSSLPGVGGLVYAEELPPHQTGLVTRLLTNAYDFFAGLTVFQDDLPAYVERAPQTASDYGEVAAALNGETARAVRMARSGEMVLSVAVPIQRYKQVVGAVMLSSIGHGIESSLREVRLGILQVFLVAFGITVLLSLYLARTIARPIRNLALAAERVRFGLGQRPQIPDYSDRNDEIGDLSFDLRQMTETLWNRMEAIEQFAADVAHEIKNPLTSLRSAVETVSRIDDPVRREKLMDILVADVKRLDRLISDISDASRLDAELSRGRFELVDLSENLRAIAAMRREILKPGQADIRLDLPADEPLLVMGQPDRLTQIFRNLIDNATSFSPPGGEIVITGRAQKDDIVITVDDEGPGIPPGTEDKIFNRFYSERPKDEQFGIHSGLGLSISRQIVSVHGGTIAAENRQGPAREVLGARFTVRLRRARDKAAESGPARAGGRR
ncbi:MAG: stimulus-sensing domain-containing protein [Alphaproteobacteria bacterium]